MGDHEPRHQVIRIPLDVAREALDLAREHLAILAYIHDFIKVDNLNSAFLWNTDHHLRNDAAEDVLLFAAVILRIKQRRLMAVKPITHAGNLGDERLRIVGPVVLDVQNGPTSCDCGPRTEEYLLLVALRIDLDEFAFCEMQPVNWRTRNAADARI